MKCICLRTTSTHRVNGGYYNKTGVPHCFVSSGPRKTQTYTQVHCCLTILRLRAELRERAISMLEAGMAACVVAKPLNVHESTISLRTRDQETNVIGPELAGYVSPPQHRTHISGYIIYVTVSWLLHPQPEKLREPQTQCVCVCGRLGFVVVGSTLSWYSRMTEDLHVVVCNWDALIVIGPSTIGCMFFSRTNPGSVCHELMGEHVFGVVLENVIRILLWSRDIAGVVRVSWFNIY